MEWGVLCVGPLAPRFWPQDADLAMRRVVFKLGFTGGEEL